MTESANVSSPDEILFRDRCKNDRVLWFVHSAEENLVAPSDHLNALHILEEIVGHFLENQ
jgi:hypothetical protein